jgi:hypothetical protein
LISDTIVLDLTLIATQSPFQGLRGFKMRIAENSPHRKWKVERLRRAEVTWQQSVKVPRDQRVDYNIENQKQERVQHGKVVVDVHWLVDC